MITILAASILISLGIFSFHSPKAAEPPVSDEIVMEPEVQPIDKETGRKIDSIHWLRPIKFQPKKK